MLRGEAESASVFPNTTDIGQSRELIYAEFLRQHAPSKCNVFLGGFLFHDETGDESKQLDVIVTTDTTPRFDFLNPAGIGKSFSPVEGTLAVASIKSTLDKKQLIDALEGIASIPPSKEIHGKKPPQLKIDGADDWGCEEWPYKIIYASDGIAGTTLREHLCTYFSQHPEISLSRRPDVIHVAGKYVIFRIRQGMSIQNSDGSQVPLAVGDYHVLTTNPDIQAIVWVLDELQKRSLLSTYIAFDYRSLALNIGVT